MDHLPVLAAALMSAGPPPAAAYNLAASPWHVPAPGSEEQGGENILLKRKE